MADRYKIETVMDIVKLAPDQRARCVVDLLRWCELKDFVSEFPSASSQQFMTWIDDKKHDATIKIVVRDEPEGED
jgi:hypothetical protein